MTTALITNPHASLYISKGWFANGLWYAQTNSSQGGTYPLYYSNDDGATWAQVDFTGLAPSPLGAVLWAVHAGSHYVMKRGDRIAYSTTGIDGWTTIAALTGLAVTDHPPPATDGTIWIAEPTKPGSTIHIRTAPTVDGTWTDVDTGISTSSFTFSLHRFDGKWWIIGNGGNVWTSTNLTSWTGGNVAALTGCQALPDGLTPTRLAVTDWSTKLYEWDTVGQAWVALTAPPTEVADANQFEMYQDMPTFWNWTGNGYQLNGNVWDTLTGPTLISSPAESVTFTTFGPASAQLFTDAPRAFTFTSVALNQVLYDVADTPAVASDAVIYATTSFLTESGDATDAQDIVAFHALHEFVTAADALSSSAVRVRDIAESAGARDAHRANVAAHVIEAASATDRADSRSSVSVIETGAIADAVSSGAVRARDVVESALAVEVFMTGGGADVAETAAATDAALTVAAVEVVEIAAATDTMEDGGVVGCDVADIALAADGSDMQVQSGACLADTATAADGVSYKQPGAVAWLMNSETGAPSWYSNFQFADLCQVGDVVLAVGPGGLATLNAATDNGDVIDAGVTWGFTEFGGYDRDGNPQPDLQKKRVAGLWFGYTSDDVLEASVETRGEPVYTYSMPYRTADQPATNRIKPGRGLNARYWRIGIHNVGGCDFAVDSLRAHVEPSSRRL